MIADAVEMQHLRRTGIEFAGVGEVLRHAYWLDLVHVVVREICEDSASIRRLPPEEFERQLVRVVPHHLLGHEIIDAGFLVDLWKLPGVSKESGFHPMRTSPPNVSLNFACRRAIDGRATRHPAY